MKEPGNIPDPYVKLYLLPGRNKDTKRKTGVVKDNCNPEYDANFEYLVSMADLLSTELEVTVATQKGFLSGGSPVIGVVRLNENSTPICINIGIAQFQVKIPLNDPEFAQQGTTEWYDLSPERFDKSD